MEQQRVLVDLDALLDTRLATIAKIDPLAALKICTDAPTRERYLHRRSDEMHLIVDTIPQAAYEEAYRTRDIETLIRAAPTEVVMTLANMVISAERDEILRTPNTKTLVVDVNTWPYTDLTEGEIQAITVAVTARAGIKTKVCSVCVAPRELVTQLIAERGWAMIIKYDLNEWYVESFKQYNAAMPPARVPETGMLVPQLLLTTANIDKPELLAGPDGKPIDPFEAFVFMLAEMIGITFTPVMTFSLLDLSVYGGDSSMPYEDSETSGNG